MTDLLPSPSMPSQAPRTAREGPDDPQTAIASLLERARRRQWALSLCWRVGAGVIGGALLAAGAGLALAHFPSAGLQLVARVMVAGAVFAPWIPLVNRSVAGARRGRGDAAAEPAELARRLTRADRRRRSLLLSAVELEAFGARWGARPEVSSALVRAHAAEAAHAVAGLDLRRELPGGPAQGILAGAALSALALSWLGVRGPPPWRTGLSRLLHLPPAVLAAAREPITGDIALTYRYPAYTGLAARTVAGTSGEVQAPAGTEVSLTTRADRSVREAALVVNGRALALAVTGERALAGGFVVDRPGNYFFRFGPSSHPTVEGPPIAIAVQADAPPQVALLSPGDVQEVEPRQALELRFQASDDYGLSELRLVFRPPGAAAEVTQSIRHFDAPPARFDGAATFALAPLGLGPGDAVTYAIEALDDDGVNGPKTTRSRPHTLKVFSAAEHHREALARARALWDRLLGLLGDRLTEAGEGEPPAVTRESPADARALELAGALDRESRALLKDQAQDKGLAVAIRNIARTENSRAIALAEARAEWRQAASDRDRAPRPPLLRRAQAASNAEIAGLERDVLYLEALLDQATNGDLLALSSELAERRRSLSGLLERYAKDPSPALKARLQAELSRLQARTAELFGRMHELAKGLSDQHVNREAVAALQKDHDLASGLARAADQLATGDVEGAMKSLDSLGAALDSMQRELRQAQPAQPSDPELARQIDGFKGDLDKLSDQQRRLAERTTALDKELRQAQAARAPLPEAQLEKLKAAVARAGAELQQVPPQAVGRTLFGEESLPEVRAQVDQLAKALAARDLEEARRSAQGALRSVSALEAGLQRNALLAGADSDDPLSRSPASPQAGGEAATDPATAALAQSRLAAAHGPLREVRDQLEKLQPEARPHLDAAQQQRLGELGREQARARQATARLGDKLDQIGERAPIFDPAAKQALEEAGEQMAGAEQRLGQGQPSPAAEAQQGALERLGKLRQAMRGAGNSGAANGAGGVPNPFALDSDREPGGDPGGEGALEDDPQKVVVPGADQYQVPAAFRRDILDAMKQKAPNNFEGQVQRYYQEIVK